MGPRPHRQLEPAVPPPELLGVEELPVGVVHPLEHVGQPADPGFGEHDLQSPMTLERAREDHGGERLAPLERGAGDPEAHLPALGPLPTPGPRPAEAPAPTETRAETAPTLGPLPRAPS